METSQFEENEKSLNTYFKDSTNSDIFDQISKHNFMNDSANNNDEVIKNVETVVDQPVDNMSTKEPIICRIFAPCNDSSIESSKKVSEGTFFDMIGTSDKSLITALSSDYNSQIKLSSHNANFSAEFQNDDSLYSLSADIDSEKYFYNVSAGNLLNTSEGDRRRDAWIPSYRTRQALLAAAGAPSGTFTLDKDFLTMPGVVLQEDMVDNVYEAVNHYVDGVEAAQRKVLTFNDVTQDERGLRELIQAECYRAAVNLTSRLLTMYGQGVGRAGYSSQHTLHSIQLWFTRISLLVKLRSWSIAWAESEPWWDLDKPDLYFQFYSELYGGRPGTIVPFSFRLLLAELPQYVHKPQEAFKRLFSTLSVVRKILQNLNNALSEDGSHIELKDQDREESIKLWKCRETRILHSVINLAFQQKDYKLSIDILQQLIKNCDHEYGVYYYKALISAIGRIYLQLGDLNSAKVWFSKSRSFKSNNQGKNSNVDFQELINDGLLALSDNNYDKAYTYFQKASIKDPTNIMVKNNMAVCLLYCGKQKEAVNLLETVLSTNPTVGLHESLLLNLCTLYELESSSAKENKKTILKMVSKYKGDAISLHCLKLQEKE